MFFGFNGVRPREEKRGDKAAIYCLKADQIASVWARQHFNSSSSTAGPDFTELHHQFLYDINVPFVDGYEIGVLKYFGMPASWNRRMQRQYEVDRLPWFLPACLNR
jgi:hypothetical protein